MASRAAFQHAGAPIDAAQLGVVLPSQHFGRRQPHIPEQRLMIAVFHDALECLEKFRSASCGEGRELFLAAQRWFLAEEADWLYSFESICGILDLDVNAVLQHLGLASVQPASCQARWDGVARPT